MTQDTATIEDIREAYAGLLIQTGENTYEIANDEETANSLFNTWLENYTQQKKAEAWDEGFNAGERDVFEHNMKDDWDKPHACIQNPYREETE